LEPEDVADAAGQLGDGVAESAFAEGAEEGEVFADLGGGGAAQSSQLTRRDRGGLRLLEKAKVDGQPPDGAVGDLPHCELFHNWRPQRKAGFRARMNAPMTRPLISRASTLSMP